MEDNKIDKIVNQVEKEILSLIFNNPENLEKAEGSGLTSEDFSVLEHREIFEDCIKLYDNGVVINPDTLEHEDKQYLVSVLKAITTSTLKHLCNTLKTIKHNLRLEQSCKDFILTKDILDTKSIEKFQEVLEIPSFELKTEVKDGDYIAEATKKEIEEFIQGRIGLKTGIRAIDNFKRGFLPGSLNIIAARPGIGKTVFSLNVTSNMDYKSKGVYFALEMSEAECKKRVVAARGDINYEDILYPTEKNAMDIMRLVDKHKFRNLKIIDKAKVNINYIKTVCKNLKKQGDLDYIFIDQLQNIDTAGLGYKKVETYPRLINELKWLARELEVPLFLLCQINREGKHKPTREDLKDSGSIEEGADCVILLHRNYQEQVDKIEEDNDKPIINYKKKEESEFNISDNQMQVIFAKNRNGKVGSKVIHCNLEKQYIGD